MLKKLLAIFGKDSGTPAGEFNKQDVLNSLRTAAIAAISGGVVIFLEKVGAIDFGPLSVVAVPAVAAAIDYVRRLATDYSK